MSKFSATQFMKKRKKIPKGTCLTCKYFYVEDGVEICLSSDKFLIPELRPHNCKRYSEVVE